jgi:hypothetical protein
MFFEALNTAEHRNGAWHLPAQSAHEVFSVGNNTENTSNALSMVLNSCFERKNGDAPTLVVGGTSSSRCGENSCWKVLH